MPFKTEYTPRVKRKIENVDEASEDLAQTHATATKKTKLTTGSRKRDQCLQAMTDWRAKHAHLDLPDIVTTYKNGKSGSSGHHCSECGAAPTTRCFKKGHVGTCPCCSQIASTRHGCDRCKHHGVTGDDMILFPPPGWTGIDGCGDDLLKKAHGKKARV